MATVKLVYFKPRGKYYTSAEFETLREHFYDVIADVRSLQAAGQLPGLAAGCTEFLVLIEAVEPWNVPHVLPPLTEERTPRDELVRIRALFAELVDEYLPVGELQRVVLSVRRSVWEQDEIALKPGGVVGAVVDVLVKKLMSEVKPEEYPDDDISDES